MFINVFCFCSDFYEKGYGNTFLISSLVCVCAWKGPQAEFKRQISVNSKNDWNRPLHSDKNWIYSLAMEIILLYNKIQFPDIPKKF